MNLVLGLEAEHADGQLVGVKVFIFTDNMVTKGAYFKGLSTSKELHGLVLLRKTEMEGHMILHLIHISRKRTLLFRKVLGNKATDWWHYAVPMEII